MEISQYLNQKIIRPYILIGSIIFFIFSLVFSSLHYLNIFYGNGLSWISWIISILTFSYSFLPPKLSFYKFFKRIPKSDYLLASFITLLYWISHLWNFTIAPWNQNGLFDDAAWDIFFAKNHAFNGPFQAAFFDNVGYISREVVFHYYISTFFKLFGYNLLVFNISLLVLGFITVFFTAFIIQRFFKNTIITLISVVILNFFPFHYLHIFMGHRYTIAAPLMVISLYFLYQAFAHKSFFRASISALFAALCWDSAIMGKQYIFGLILAAIFILVLGRRKWKSKENIAISIVWIIGFIISAAPLLVYIFFNYDNYVFRENNLFGNFLLGYGQNGVLGVRQNLDQLIELFFAEDTFKRQFLHDFLLIPIAYYFFLIPGFLIALFKKRFEIVFLAVIPVLGAFISGSYDFRVLLAVPIWIICIGFYLNFLFKTRFIFGKNIQYAFIAISLFFVLLGLIPSVKYLWDVSKDPHHVYLLPHKDVAVSRLVQDIVVGSKNPTSKMKKDDILFLAIEPNNIYFGNRYR